MKSNDIKALHENSIEELKLKLSKMVLNLANMRLSAKAGKLESPAELKALRKDIARVKTIITEKELSK